MFALASYIINGEEIFVSLTNDGQVYEFRMVDKRLLTATDEEKADIALKIINGKKDMLNSSINIEEI